MDKYGQRRIREHNTILASSDIPQITSMTDLILRRTMLLPRGIEMRT